jgi:hypothetical protein
MPLQLVLIHELSRSIQRPAINIQYEHPLPERFLESGFGGQLVHVAIFVRKVLRGYGVSDRSIQFSYYIGYREGNVCGCAFLCVPTGTSECEAFKLSDLVELTVTAQSD